MLDCPSDCKSSARILRTAHQYILRHWWHKSLVDINDHRDMTKCSRSAPPDGSDSEEISSEPFSGTEARQRVGFFNILDLLATLVISSFYSQNISVRIRPDRVSETFRNARLQKLCLAYDPGVQPGHYGCHWPQWLR